MARARLPDLSLTEWAVLAVVAEAPAHGFAIAKELAPTGDLGRILRSLDRWPNAQPHPGDPRRRDGWAHLAVRRRRGRHAGPLIGLQEVGQTAAARHLGDAVSREAVQILSGLAPGTRRTTYTARRWLAADRLAYSVDDFRTRVEHELVKAVTHLRIWEHVYGPSTELIAFATSTSRKASRNRQVSGLRPRRPARAWRSLCRQ